MPAVYVRRVEEGAVKSIDDAGEAERRSLISNLRGPMKAETISVSPDDILGIIERKASWPIRQPRWLSAA
jgi:hypothetical protein